MSTSFRSTVPTTIRRRLGALAATVAITTLGIGLAGTAASPAAATPSEASPLRHGIVDVSGSLTARSLPTTHSAAAGSYRDGATIAIDCKVHGPEVAGNDLWYGVPITGPGRVWVSARYVDNDGPAPEFCNPSDGFFAGRATATLTQRSGASTADASSGRYAAGARVGVGCFVGSAGNRWYYTDRNSWVKADHVSVNSEVLFCANRSDV